MPKQCKHPECTNPVFGGGYCKWHQGHRTDKKPKPLKKTPINQKPRKKIKPASDKRLQQLATYRPKRDKYLLEHPICEVHDCTRKTTNLHHKRGREHNVFFDDWARDNDIPLLHDERWFLACCSLCHPVRIHEDPEWAREHGYIL